MNLPLGMLITLLACHATLCSQVMSAPQEKDIRAAVERLVLSDGRDAPDPVEILRKLRDREITVEESLPPRNPNMILPGDDAKPTPEERAYRERYDTCHAAFKKLLAYKQAAFPVLMEHFEDERQSIAFQNHFPASSVGAACQYIIEKQLRDAPEETFYALTRKGRDGRPHSNPHYNGTPFDDMGGLALWLKANDGLSYPQMQVKCLEWLLEKEKAIGAPDAESYFEIILPLEIHTLRRKKEAGQDVGKELERLTDALQKKDVKIIPKDILPE